MPREYPPFYEVASSDLSIASLTAGRMAGRAGFTSLIGAEIRILLKMLLKSQMPAEAAHKLARDHAGLPDLLKLSGHHLLATFAEEVIADLKARQPEALGQNRPASESALFS